VLSDWRRWRLRVPEGVVLAYADAPKEDRAWVGPVQVTAVRRTLAACLAAGVAPDLMEQAFEQAGASGRLAYLRISTHAIRITGGDLGRFVRSCDAATSFRGGYAQVKNLEAIGG
jgi:hypothetical protein